VAMTMMVPSPFPRLLHHPWRPFRAVWRLTNEWAPIQTPRDHGGKMMINIPAVVVKRRPRGKLVVLSIPLLLPPKDHDGFMMMMATIG